MEVADMLCQFTVKNYKSIRDEITFDMQAAAISEHENKIIKGIDGELFYISHEKRRTSSGIHFHSIKTFIDNFILFDMEDI